MNLEKLVTPELLATRLAAAIPQQLKCVVLYGSAAAGDFVPGASNYNLLILLEPLTTSELDAIGPTIVSWSRAGYPPPLLFTPDEFTASIDAFPIELLDIQQSRRVLWGPDLLAQIQVHPHHLRLQVERELTGKLLSLRGKYLLTEGRQEGKTELMLRSLSTILVLFRAALRLYQDDVPATKLAALHALRKYIDFDVEPFQRLFDMKPTSAEPRGTPPVSFDSYLKAIEAVASAVNLQNSTTKE
jgi:hypothetical protein